jgi:hypothetical protein
MCSEDVSGLHVNMSLKGYLSFLWLLIIGNLITDCGYLNWGILENTSGPFLRDLTGSTLSQKLLS